MFGLSEAIAQEILILEGTFKKDPKRRAEVTRTNKMVLIYQRNKLLLSLHKPLATLLQPPPRRKETMTMVMAWVMT